MLRYSLFPSASHTRAHSSHTLIPLADTFTLLTRILTCFPQPWLSTQPMWHRWLCECVSLWGCDHEVWVYECCERVIVWEWVWWYMCVIVRLMSHTMCANIVENHFLGLVGSHMSTQRIINSNWECFMHKNLRGDQSQKKEKKYKGKKGRVSTNAHIWICNVWDVRVSAGCESEYVYVSVCESEC